MINIGPTLPNTSSRPVKSERKADTSNAAIAKQLPKHHDYLVRERRNRRERRSLREPSVVLLDLRSGRDRRRHSTREHIDLSV